MLQPQNNKDIVLENRRYVDCSDSHLLILSTAANPLHRGHLHMMNKASQLICKISGKVVHEVFELSTFNADKGILHEDEINERVNQFINAGYRYSLSRLPAFIAKYYEYRQLTMRFHFIIGSDTFKRICNVEQFHFGNRDSLIRSIKILSRHLFIFNRPNCDTVKDIFDKLLPELDYTNYVAEVDDVITSVGKIIVVNSNESISSTEIRNAKASSSPNSTN